MVSISSKNIQHIPFLISDLGHLNTQNYSKSNLKYKLIISLVMRFMINKLRIHIGVQNWYVRFSVCVCAPQKLVHTK